MNVHGALHAAMTVLKASNNSGEEKREAQLLLSHLLNVNHAWLIAHADDELDDKQQDNFQALLQRRIHGEPIAYILGQREFYGLTLKVTPNTLIPRPDTETLVEAALEKIPVSPPPLRVVDLGTGSGAIALAIAQHRPQVQVTAVDASENALKIAQENAQHLKINNVSFVVSSWLSALENEHFDLIVSNPPYIKESDPHLSQGDLRFEPHSALTSGDDGLADIRIIIQQATKQLKPNGWLMFEHSYNQALSASLLLASAHFTNIKTLQDLGGNDRVTIGFKP